MADCPRCGIDNGNEVICRQCGMSMPVVTPVVNTPITSMDQTSVPPAKTDPMAIVALILSLLCLGIVGIICGIISIVNISKSQGRLKGMPLAIVAIVYPVLFMPVFGAILFPVFVKARDKARQTTCMANLRHLSVQTQLLIDDHGDRLPTGEMVWAEARGRSWKVLVCPKVGGSQISYGYNAHVAGFKSGDFSQPENLLLIADGGNQTHAIRTVEDIDLNRHVEGGQPGYIATFLDGHVARVSLDGPLPRLR